MNIIKTIFVTLLSIILGFYFGVFLGTSPLPLELGNFSILIGVVVALSTITLNDRNARCRDDSNLKKAKLELIYEAGVEYEKASIELIYILENNMRDPFNLNYKEQKSWKPDALDTTRFEHSFGRLKMLFGLHFPGVFFDKVKFDLVSLPYIDQEIKGEVLDCYRDRNDLPNITWVQIKNNAKFVADFCFQRMEELNKK